MARISALASSSSTRGPTELILTAGMVVSWLTSQFRTGRSRRKLAMRLDGKREPDYHVERADAAAAWRRHFQTAAFLLERGPDSCWNRGLITAELELGARDEPIRA